LGSAAELVIAVGTPAAFAMPEVFDDLRRAYARARIVTCAHSVRPGDGEEVALVALALAFERCRANVVFRPMPSAGMEVEVGRAVCRALPHEDLRHAFVFAGGSGLDGDAIAVGLATGLSPQISVMGGVLDGGVGLDAPPSGRAMVAIGFRGARIDLGLALHANGGALLGLPASGRLLEGEPGNRVGRFAILFEDCGGGEEPARTDFERIAWACLGARPALIRVPVQAVLGRCDGMALPLCLPDGLALAAVGESRTRSPN
jgi:hypothetical protein